MAISTQPFSDFFCEFSSAGFQYHRSYQDPTRPNDGDFFDSVSANDHVHGCMFRVSTVPSAKPWTGTSDTWKLIEDLNLDKTVNIVALIKHYQMFQSFSDDTYMTAAAANQSIYHLQDLLTADTLSESIALQWTANKQRILHQQLKEIYRHDILPLQLHEKFVTVIKFSGNVVARQYLTECASDTSDNTDDEHSLPDSFTHS